MNTLLASILEEKLDKATARERVEAKYKMPLNDVLRERAGKSVRELAAELGISKSLVANWRKENER